MGRLERGKGCTGNNCEIKKVVLGTMLRHKAILKREKERQRERERERAWRGEICRRGAKHIYIWKYIDILIKI